MKETRAAMGRVSGPAIALYETWKGLLLNTLLCKTLNLLYFVGLKDFVVMSFVRKNPNQCVCDSF